MKIEMNDWLAAFMVAVVGAAVLVGPAQGQEQAYEYGRVVVGDEQGESLEYLEGEVIEEDHLPWNPFLSPWMFCLDCLITKAVKISDHYNQQAAQRYFAESETCADIPLGYDPCSTGLRYTVLSPFYAACPDMLIGGGWVNNLKNRVGFGGGAPGYGPYGNYGMSAPMPSVATQGPGGPVLMTPASGSAAPPAPGAPQLMPPAAPASPSGGSAQAPSSLQTAQAGNGSPWGSMTDAQILAHFGLQSSVVQTSPGGQLDAPVAPGQEWEFADQSTSTSALDVIAMTQQPTTDNPALLQGLPPGAVIVSEKPAEKKSAEKEAFEPTKNFDVDRALAEVKAGEDGKSFSVTDREYDRLKSIGDSMLDF